MHLPPDPEEGSHEPRKREGEPGNYYICARSTKRNPDLLIPGGALKGNMYFQSKSDAKKEEEKSGEASDLDDDDAFSKLKN